MKKCKLMIIISSSPISKSLEQVSMGELVFQDLVCLASRFKNIPVIGLINGKIIKEQGIVEILSIRPINIVLSELLNWKIVPDPDCLASALKIIIQDNNANNSGNDSLATINATRVKEDSSQLASFPSSVGIFTIINENYEYEFNIEELDMDIMKHPFKIILQMNRQLDGNVDQDVDPFFSIQMINPLSNTMIPYHLVDQRYATAGSSLSFSSHPHSNLFSFTSLLDQRGTIIGNHQRIIKESIWSKSLLFNNELTRIMECQSHLRDQIRKRIENLEELCEIKRKNKDPDYVAGSRKKCPFNQVRNFVLNLNFPFH